MTHVTPALTSDHVTPALTCDPRVVVTKLHAVGHDEVSLFHCRDARKIPNGILEDFASPTLARIMIMNFKNARVMPSQKVLKLILKIPRFVPIWGHLRSLVNVIMYERW